MAKKKAIIMILKVSERSSVPLESWEQLLGELRHLGIVVHIVQQEVANYILIGKRIVWYGSIHPFGTVEPDDTLLRLEDPTYAADFASIVGEVLLVPSKRGGGVIDRRRLCAR